MNFFFYTSVTAFIVMFLAILVFAIFLIIWIISKYAKKDSIKKAGKLGSIISGMVVIIALLIGGVTDLAYTHIKATHNRQFLLYSRKYKSLYLKTASLAEDVGNSESKKWSDDIDDADDIDDFDVEDTISNATDENSDDIETINSNMKKIRNYVSKMKKNETPDHKFSKYSKSYSELKKFTNLVTSPSGSYNSFTDDLSDYDNSTANAYKELE